ncbi:hypothetical protein QAD02_019696 [Eretmocerus hayati]|uniref:Uncharacterized protein n=1 Tax=Eretmocerus hayati TaxID=131215 RepID=A0ACC2PJZ0_9HYME|nr:hypothetical protein QAD02_019696 [Eretmocerus hayati]
MSSIDESNVDKLRSEHECDEHWELRRKFLLAHKDKFPRDKLICLAQCFTNIEFLGCKYPSEVMQTVAELSQEVAQEYRDRQKTRLQRTFVKASDAASSKAKGQSRQSTGTSPEQSPTAGPSRGGYGGAGSSRGGFGGSGPQGGFGGTGPPRGGFGGAGPSRGGFGGWGPSRGGFGGWGPSRGGFGEGGYSQGSFAGAGPSRGGFAGIGRDQGFVSAGPMGGFIREETSQGGFSRVGSSHNQYSNADTNQYSNQRNAPPTTHTSKRGHSPIRFDQEIEPKKRKQNYNRQNLDIVLFEYLNDTPQSIISRAANSYDKNVEWKFDRINENCLCTVFFNGRKLAQAEGLNQKEAKKESSVIALQQLQRHYYTIKVTKNLTPTVTDNFEMNNSSSNETTAIGNDNIGSKMMKMMGWSGGGLGKASQGITEPVNVQQQMTREGLGLKPGMYNMHVFKNKLSEVLYNYMQSDSSTDLVFSPCFSNEERALIHQIAKQIGLKSQSYGPKSQRIMTISRKVDHRTLVNELIEMGGVTEKYQLIEPLGE